MPPMTANRVVLCFHPKDAEIKDQLLLHLDSFRRYQQIAFWDSSQIAPGHDQQSEVNQALKDANVAVLMLSAAFLASAFFHDVAFPLLEKRYKAGSVKIALVLLRSCNWELQKKLKEFPVYPRNRKSVASHGDDRVDGVDKILSEIAYELGTLIKGPEAPAEREGESASPARNSHKPTVGRWWAVAVAIFCLALGGAYGLHFVLTPKPPPTQPSYVKPPPPPDFAINLLVSPPPPVLPPDAGTPPPPPGAPRPVIPDPRPPPVYRPKPVGVLTPPPDEHMQSVRINVDCSLEDCVVTLKRGGMAIQKKAYSYDAGHRPAAFFRENLAPRTYAIDCQTRQGGRLETF